MQGLHLERVNFHQAILAKADLSRPTSRAETSAEQISTKTNFPPCFLVGANLQGVLMVNTNLTGAISEAAGCMDCPLGI